MKAPTDYSLDESDNAEPEFLQFWQALKSLEYKSDALRTQIEHEADHEPSEEAPRYVDAPFSVLIIKSLAKSAVAYDRIMRETSGNPEGLELRSSRRDAWGFVLPDVSGDNPGGTRIQYFDLDHFSGHSCCASVPEALNRLLVEGYRTPDAGALDRASSTQRWALGGALSALLQQHHQGVLTFDAMYAEGLRLRSAMEAGEWPDAQAENEIEVFDEDEEPAKNSPAL